MSTPAERYDAVVTDREILSPHLLRLRLSVPGFASSGVADEWVGLVVPGQFQVRYYTVRSIQGDQLVLDVVAHDEGLVTEWATGHPVGDRVVVTAPQSAFTPPPDSRWLLLVGDLTALPAMARISEETSLLCRVWAEVADDLTGYFPLHVDVTWLEPS